MILSTEEIVDVAAVTATDNPVAVFIEPDQRLDVAIAKRLKTRLRMQADHDSLIGVFHCQCEPDHIRQLIERKLAAAEVAA